MSVRRDAKDARDCRRSFAPTGSALGMTVLSLKADLCVLIAFEYAHSAAEGRKFYFGEAVADRAEKPFCVFRSTAAETVRVWFEERFGAIVHSAGRRLRIQIERVGAGKAHFHQATAALHGVNTGANEIPVEENVAGGGSQIYPGQLRLQNLRAAADGVELQKLSSALGADQKTAGSVHDDVARNFLQVHIAGNAFQLHVTDHLFDV